MPVDSEISPPTRQAIGEGLSQLLSDTYVLFLKTHRFHWSLGGATCSTLSQMFEEQYVELASAVDALAERICALGFPALGRYSLYARLSSVTLRKGLPPDREMITQLVQGHDTVVRAGRGLLTILSNANDPATLELVSQRVERHEQLVGALRALQQTP